jgi:hypothetical protein
MDNGSECMCFVCFSSESCDVLRPMSRALCDRDAGPRLRSSYSRSVVITVGLCPHAAHACRVMPPGARLREEEGE